MAIYREKFFPWLLDHVATAQQLEPMRDRLVSQAVGHVLEIGSGTGANFLWYAGSITSLTTVDPNPGMNRRARRLVKYLDFPVDTRELGCEHLPMKDETFDCVVSTLTLCSLGEVEKSLNEVFRVLKSGGRFLFLEHGLSESDSVGRWQKRITPLQRRLFDGCCLNREIGKLVRQAGFQIVKMENYYLDKIPRPFGYMYEGVAAK